MRLTALLLALALSTSCATHIGKVEPKECVNILYVSVGQTTGPCDLKGGTISLPGAQLAGSVVSGIAKATLSLFGRAPIVITHDTGEESEEE